MSERPTGTVTFLFTDIEGSTQLLQELGDRYPETLDDHRRILRGAFARHCGFEVDTQGDAFFVAFSRAQDAVLTAADAQRALAAHRWAKGGVLRVRMGVHTCEATATAEGYVGIGVHRGARICAAGHGGQVLLSQTTRELVEEGALAFGLRDLGAHRLKDLTEPQRLYQLAGDGLQADFPPLRTLENRPTNLPVQPTPLVGREREVIEIGDLIRHADKRLVTLTGPGGTGKTRLALQAAAELIDEFPNGVFFVALAPILDPVLVISTIAQTLGINETAGQSFSAYIATKKLLLLVDNFEQVSAAAPQLADLLAHASGLTLLVTSREPVRISAEHIYPVAPLGLPNPKHLPELAALSQYESVALFVERVQAIQPTFEVTSENAPAVAEICIRLDGLPLALELAAARIPLLSPEAMLGRLDERLKLLSGGARDLPQRQQTLRDTLAWSYDLLGEPEQKLFARLGVFVGGFALEAAEEVCEAPLDDLASLVDKSLLRRMDERLTMLETILEYARDRLAASEENETLHGRHAAFYLQLAEAAYAERIEREREWAERLEQEHDNLRAALDWFAKNDPGSELRLAGALGWFWRVRSHLTEGRERLASILKQEWERNVLLARAMTSAGTLASWQGDLVAARPMLEAGIELWQELGDEAEEAHSLEALGWGYFMGGLDAEARTQFERSLDLHTRAGDRRLVNRAQLAFCVVLVSQGDLQLAEPLSREALALAEEQGDAWGRHLAHHYLADCALIGEDYASAEERYGRSLRDALALGDRSEIAIELQGVAMAAAGRSHPKRALRLAAAAETEFAALGVDFSGIVFWSALLEKNLGRARYELGTDLAGAAWNEGVKLGIERAVDEALTPSV